MKETPSVSTSCEPIESSGTSIESETDDPKRIPVPSSTSMCGRWRKSATSRAQSPAPSISVTVRMTSLTVIRGRFSPGRGDSSTLRLPSPYRTLGARAHLSTPRGLSMGSAAHVRDLALPHLSRDTRAADGPAPHVLVAAAHLPLPFRRLPRTERMDLLSPPSFHGLAWAPASRG